MEWMLQVVDEVDDAIGAVRLWSVGIAAEIGLSVVAGIGVAAIGAAIWLGEEPVLIFAAAGMLSVAAALKIHGSQLKTSR